MLALAVLEEAAALAVMLSSQWIVALLMEFLVHFLHLNLELSLILLQVLVTVLKYVLDNLADVAVPLGLARCRVGVCRRETREGPSGR